MVKIMLITEMSIIVNGLLYKPLQSNTITSYRLLLRKVPHSYNSTKVGRGS